MKSQALAADTYPAECCRAKGVTSIKQLAGLSLIQTQTVIDLLLCRPETVFLQDGSYSTAAQQFAVFIGLPGSAAWIKYFIVLSGATGTFYIISQPDLKK